MLQPIEARKVLLQKVTDASGLEELIEKGVFKADDVIGSSEDEGNGGSTTTRGFSRPCFREVLVRRNRSWDEVRQIPLACREEQTAPQPPRDDLRQIRQRGPVTDEPRLSVESQ